MILKNKKLNREIDIDFNFFREEYADAIKEAFSNYRDEKITLFPDYFKDDFSLEFNFYFEFEYLFNKHSTNYKVEFQPLGGGSIQTLAS